MKQKKVWDSYEQLKFNYKDILTDEDLLEAFDNDKMIEKMKKSIHKSEIIYLSMWIIFLIGSIIVVEYLSLCPTYSKILNALQRISELILNFSIEHY